METALVLPIIVGLMVAGLGGVVVATYKLGCVARARDVALAAARGAEAPPAGVVPGAHESVEFGSDGTVAAMVQIGPASCTSTAVVEP